MSFSMWGVVWLLSALLVIPTYSFENGHIMRVLILIFVCLWLTGCPFIVEW